MKPTGGPAENTSVYFRIRLLYTRILVKHKGEFDVKCIACFQEDVNIVKIRIKSHETVCAFLKIQMILSQFFFPFFLAKKYNQFLKTIGSEILKCL